MVVLSLSRARQGAAPSRHNSPGLAPDPKQCPDSPTGYHLRRRGELRCLCCKCRLPLTATAHKPYPVGPALLLGDSFMTRAMLPTLTNTLRLAHAQAEKLIDASMECSPAEDRYRRLAERIDAALAEIVDTEVLS